jgi:hypothetical protein
MIDDAGSPALDADLRCRHNGHAAATHLVEFGKTGCLCWPDVVQALCSQHLLKGMEAAWPHGRIIARLISTGKEAR